MIEKYKDFEDYLQDVHARQYIGVDDDMPDSYDAWIDALDQEDWIYYYGNKYAHTVEMRMLQEIEKTLDNKLGK